MSCAPAVAVAMWDNNYIYCELELQSCYDPHTTYFRESVVLCFRQRRQVSQVSTYSTRFTTSQKLFTSMLTKQLSSALARKNKESDTMCHTLILLKNLFQ